MSYKLNLAKQGNYKFVDYRIDKDVCAFCGTKIVHKFYIENIETGKIIIVGSECVKHLVGDSQADRIVKLIKSKSNSIKHEYIKPIKNEWLREILYNYKDKIDRDSFQSWLWRINHNTNTEITIREMKILYSEVFVEVFKNTKFKLTKEQKEELENLQQSAVRECLNEIK